MKKVSGHLLAATLLCWGFVADAAQLIVELKEQAQQRSVALPLGAVVDIGGDGVLQQQLRNTMLPAKGKIGDTVVYTREEIADYLNTKYAESSNGHREKLPPLHWRGAQRVLVQRQGLAIEPQEYIDWASAQLQRHWAVQQGRFELKPVNVYRPLLVPVGTRSITARFDSNAVRRTAKVWLDIAVDKQYYTSVAVVFDVRWWHPALVLKQRGIARQLLQADLAGVAEVDISLLNGALLKDATQLNGKRLRHDLPAGLPLGAGDIEDRPAIELGATVQVYTSVGRVAIQTQAVAQRDGAIGQRIAVRNSKTNEQLMVDVIGENRAVVSDRQTP